MNKFVTLIVLLSIVVSSCISNTQMKEEIRYVPIGDSYTIAQGLVKEESFPYILTEHLKSNNISIRLIANPARTGYTTKEVINYELPIFKLSEPTFSTLLIGVNDYVQGIDKETFRNNFAFILDEMLKVLPDKKLIVITIPDFSVTPEGKKFFNQKNASREIEEFNQIIINESQLRKLKVVDIYQVSKEMKNKELVAKDGLHPSFKEYLIWEELIYPEAYQMLLSNFKKI